MKLSGYWFPCAGKSVGERSAVVDGDDDRAAEACWNGANSEHQGPLAVGRTPAGRRQLDDHAVVIGGKPGHRIREPARRRPPRSPHNLRARPSCRRNRRGIPGTSRRARRTAILHERPTPRIPFRQQPGGPFQRVFVVPQTQARVGHWIRRLSITWMAMPPPSPTDPDIRELHLPPGEAVDELEAFGDRVLSRRPRAEAMGGSTAARPAVVRQQPQTEEPVSTSTDRWPGSWQCPERRR